MSRGVLASRGGEGDLGGPTSPRSNGVGLGETPSGHSFQENSTCVRKIGRLLNVAALSV